MKSIDINTKWKTGSGVSGKDLCPVRVEIADNQYLFESTGYIGGESLLSGDSQFTYIQETDVRVNPGFFYINDREFYAYNEKITQFNHLEQSGDISYIPLRELPNGPGTIQYGEFLKYRYFDREDEKTGTPPIIVKYYPSGTMESIGVIFETAVSSTSGISKQIGYRMSGEVFISGDTESYPDYFTPLSRFTKCPEYWRNDNILKYDEYEYDFFNNRIIITSGDPSLEYSVEYENLNIPFRCGIELNTLKTAPGDYVLVITPDSNQEAPAAGISIDVSNTITAGDIINITARVTDANGVSLSGAPVILSIYDQDLTLSGTTNNIIDGTVRTPFHFNTSGATYDAIPASEGMYLRYRNTTSMLISNNNIINGSFLIPSIGNIVGNNFIPDEWQSYNTSCPFGAFLSGNTDAFGQVKAAYIPPHRLNGDMNLILEARTSDNISSGINISTVSNTGNNKLLIDRTVFREGIEYQIATYDVPNNLLYLDLPASASFPTTVILHEAWDYLNGTDTPTLPVVLSKTDNNIRLGYSSIGNYGYDPARTRAVLTYAIKDEYSAMDGRGNYGI